MKPSIFSANLGQSLLVASGLMLLTSCVGPTKPKPLITNYISTEKIPLKIALNITEDFKKVNWGDAFPGDMTATSILTNEAAKCARSTFAEVVEFQNGTIPTGAFDAILTPSAANITRKPGQTMFSSDGVSVKMGWTLIDSSEKLIWEGTASGQGMNASGWASVLAQSLEAVFQKSQAMLLSAPEIKRLAAVKNPSAQRPSQPSDAMHPEVKQLCLLLQSDNRGVVIDTLKKLRQTNSPEAVPYILPCLFDGHPNVMRDACRTLAVLADRSVIIYLEPLLKAKDSSVRDDANKAIATLRAR